jgi:hypothetical protein
MGIDLTYRIEFKNRRTANKWTMVKLLVPIEKYGWFRDINSPDNTKHQSYYDEDVDLNIDNHLYHYCYEDSIRGTVRDILSPNSWHDIDVDAKGLPDDMSDELKEYCSSETLAHCWGKSYLTIAELNHIYQELFTRQLNQYIQDKVGQRFEYLNGRFDRLEKLILQQKVSTLKQFKSQNNFDFNVVDQDEINDSLNEAIWFGKWVHGIKSIAEFFTGTWLDDDEVRIVYFFS